MNPSSAPQKAEVVKLGPPASGEVTITVDPALAGTSFAAGTYALQPKAEIPAHRLMGRDELMVICKGQGRAILGEQSLIVVPGSLVFVPRGTWQGLRNTGTGLLQFVWVASPPGQETLFRELGRAGSAPSPEALQEIAQRHGLEFRAPGVTPSPAEAPVSGGRRRHRGGRRHRGRDRAAAPTAPSAQALAAASMTPAPAAPPSSATASPVVPGDASRKRRHRGGRGRRRGAAPSGGAPPPAASPSSPAAPARRQETKGGASAAGRRRSGRPHFRGRPKEVYMGGQWVRVQGDEPVIAPGREQMRRRAKPSDDDEPPGASLTVPL